MLGKFDLGGWGFAVVCVMNVYRRISAMADETHWPTVEALVISVKYKRETEISSLWTGNW